MPPAARHRIEARMRHLWPPGPYTLASAAAAIACAAAECSRCTFPCWVVLHGELGVRGRAAAFPLAVCPTGVDRVIVPELSVQERVQLENALAL
jgi:malate/lactate dehydrogenase